MRLVLIYNIWSDWDLLKSSLDAMIDVVDGVIIIGSKTSNYGEISEIPREWHSRYLYRYEPKFIHASHSETDKRNYGLQVAKDNGYTHFICLDADEIYDPLDIVNSKQRFIDNPNLAGLVCRTKVYVKSPTLTIGYDTTLVPFIHKITPGLKHEFNKQYPFAWEGKNLRIDPTRSLNINSGVEWSDITMHHYSWVRKDIEKKIRNSTARANLQRMDLVNKFIHLKEGDIFDLYPNKPLVREQARFNVPDYGVVQDLQPSTGSGTDSKPI